MKRPGSAMARVAFLGGKALGYRVLQVLLDEVTPPYTVAGVICPDDRGDGRSVLTSFQHLADEWGLSMRMSSDTETTCAELGRLAPDVAVVCGWYTLIPLARSPRTAFYGLHASPLPRYRGRAPVVWQIINGEREVGLTLFRLAPGADAGDIVDQDTVPLAPHETVADALGRLEDLAVRLVRAHLAGMLDGSAPLRSQDHSRATYFATRRPEDGLIDWHQPCVPVHDFVRAQTAPYPGAFTRLPDGRILRIWRTEPLPSSRAEPGRVVVTLDGMIVGCGEGSVRILSASIDREAARPVVELLPEGRLELLRSGADRASAARHA